METLLHLTALTLMTESLARRNAVTQRSPADATDTHSSLLVLVMMITMTTTMRTKKRKKKKKRKK